MLRILRQWWYRRNRALAVDGPLKGHWLQRRTPWCVYKVPGQLQYVVAPYDSAEALYLLKLTIAGKALYPGLYHLDPKSGTFAWGRNKSRLLTGRRSDT